MCFLRRKKAQKESILRRICIKFLSQSSFPSLIRSVMEDGSKVHLGYARLPRLEHGVRGFNWPPSSPDLNVIEKVWRWMKEELKRLPFVPTSVDQLKREIQRLWDQVNPHDYQPYVERLTCKLEDVISLKGLATIHWVIVQI